MPLAAARGINGALVELGGYASAGDFSSHVRGQRRGTRSRRSLSLWEQDRSVDSQTGVEGKRDERHGYLHQVDLLEASPRDERSDPVGHPWSENRGQQEVGRAVHAVDLTEAQLDFSGTLSAHLVPRLKGVERQLGACDISAPCAALPVGLSQGVNGSGVGHDGRHVSRANIHGYLPSVAMTTIIY